MIKIENLFKHYGSGETMVHALNGISLDIGDGEFTAIAGPSGGGKTTLLNSIGCLDTFDTGTLEIAGQNIQAFTEEQRTQFRRENLGFIFQSFNLIPVLTAYENIALPLTLLGVPKNEMNERVLQALKEVEISQKKDRFPRELSGGQQQRVAIARALIKQPKLVLADEPTANLDSRIGREILETMLFLNKEKGITFVFSTHDRMVMDMAHRVVYLQDGQIVDQLKG
jgi:putative ABC transport system ATP-binding protein